MVIAYAYRASGSDLTIFCYNTGRLVNHVTTKKTIVVCSDISIDLLKYDTRRGTKHFLDLMFKLGTQ